MTLKNNRFLSSFTTISALAIAFAFSNTAFAYDPVGQQGTTGANREIRTRVKMSYNPGDILEREETPSGTIRSGETSHSPPRKRHSVNGASKGWAPWMALMFQGHAKENAKVNNLLTLKPAQKFLMRVDPRIMRTQENGDVHLEPIRNGKWKISIMLFSPKNFEERKFSADNLIAEYSGTVKAKFDGNVAADVVLRIHDVAAVLSRSMAVVVVEPDGEASKHTGAGIYYAPSGPLKANRVDFELRDLDDADEETLAQLDYARKRANVSLSGVQMLGVAGYTKLADQNFINKRVFKKVFDGNDINVVKKLCLALVPAKLTVDPIEPLRKWMGKKDNARINCLKSYGRYFQLEVRDFVESVQGVKYLPENFKREYINITRDVNNLVISRQEVNQNINFGLYGDFGVHKGVPLPGAHLAGGAKVSTGMNLHLFRARTKEKIFNAQIHEGEHFQVYKDGYSLDLVLRRCLVIQPRMPSVKGAYGCLTKAHRKKVTENYYLVNHQMEGSPFTDNDDPDITNWRMIIRGESSYTDVKQLLSTEHPSFEMIRFIFTFGGTDVRRPLIPDMRMTQEFPGAIVAGAR